MTDALVYAIGVAISPVAIGSVLLILSSAHALPNAASFAAGWIVGVAIVASLFALAVQGVGLSDSEPVWIAVLELVVGAAFLAMAARLSIMRPRGTSPWVEVVDRVSATRTATLGLILAGANPKVFALALGSALTLASAGAGASLTVATVVLFTAVGAIGVLVPVAVYAAYPVQAAARLGALRVWLAGHERGVLLILALAIATFFIRDALRVLGT